MEFLHESDHEKFRFRTIDEIVRKAGELGLTIPVSENLEVLGEPVRLSWAVIPNSLSIHAMEGCDGTRGGEPAELTYRRYRRFASGGAGLLWGEATAVVEEGRANPRQLWIRKENLEAFRALRQEMRDAARSVSLDHSPVTVVQLTHSGRYSKPRGKAQPVIAHHSPYLDPTHGLPADYPLITDGELDALQDKYVEAARLARDAGFEAVDVKACHGYLLYELLGASTRENSKYGGSFENRTRFIREVCARIREEVPGIAVVTRLTVYDATPYPYGFGMATDGSLKPDLTEPIQLIRMLKDIGVELVNVATGNPYYNPHIERPFDTPVAGAYVPREHPLANIGENVRITREISKAVSGVKTIFSGISWLRHFIHQVAAGLKSRVLGRHSGRRKDCLRVPALRQGHPREGEAESDRAVHRLLVLHSDHERRRADRVPSEGFGDLRADLHRRPAQGSGLREAAGGKMQRLQRADLPGRMPCRS